MDVFKCCLSFILLCGTLSAQEYYPETRNCIKEEGSKLVGVTEELSNDSPEIRTILANAGFYKPAAYCSATVKYLFDICLVMTEITAWSPTAVPEARAVWKGGKEITRAPMYSDVFGIYSPRKGRVSHAGIIFHWPDKGNYFLSLEGNVGIGDGAQGITVLRRKKTEIHIVCDWIDSETLAAVRDSADTILKDTPLPEQIKEKQKESKFPIFLSSIVVAGLTILLYGRLT